MVPLFCYNGLLLSNLSPIISLTGWVQILPCFNERVPIFWDPHIKAWTAENNSHLKGLDFDNFLAEFRDEWLPKDWEADTRTGIVSSNLDPLKSALPTGHAASWS